MKVTITGRSMQVHDSVREYAEQKVQRLERYSEQLQRVEVILSAEGDNKVVECIVVPRKGQDRVIGQAEHEDQYAAIDLVLDKMAAQLRKQSEKRKDARKKRSGRVPPPPMPSDEVEDEELESYEDVVDKFSEKLES